MNQCESVALISIAESKNRILPNSILKEHFLELYSSALVVFIAYLNFGYNDFQILFLYKDIFFVKLTLTFLLLNDFKV